MIIAERYHDISCGHRVFGHESKCAHLHGHNYRIHFAVLAPKLDPLGRVVDFGVIKSTLCQWLEDNWDHKFLLWAKDDVAAILSTLDPLGVVLVPFNPTAENMADHLLNNIGPRLLMPLNMGLQLMSVRVEETRKCSATAVRG